jgi:pyruvate dehydrogenase E1 component
MPHWREEQTGQHIELGIGETTLAGQLGATWSRWGRTLLPIGLLDTPSSNGVTLAPEGGAHQSITTPSIGIEQPGCVTYEPALVIDVKRTPLGLPRPPRPA